MAGIIEMVRKFLGVRDIIKAEYKSGIMTIFYDDGTTDKYKGDCTVWHEVPYMRRCGTLKEALLSEIWTYIKEYGNPYPNAHEDKIVE